MFQQVLLCFTGFCAGIIVAGGVSGLLIGLSIVPRYAGITHTANHIFLYEDMSLLGTVAGTIVTPIQTLTVTVTQPIIDISLHFDTELLHFECALIKSGIIPFHVEITVHIKIEIELVRFLLDTGDFFKQAFVTGHEITSGRLGI